MTEQYAGALLYLVPVAVAAVVAFIVTRPEKPAPVATSVPPSPDAPATRSTDPAYVARPVRIPAQRVTYQPPNNRRATPAPPPSPTLLHAALSSHFAAVAGSAASASAAATASAAASAKQPVIRPSRLVSIRKPARIPRRPVHRCPHKP